MTGVNGETKPALGKVNLEISIYGKCKTQVKAEVTEATSYNILIGVDWMVQNYMTLNPKGGTMTIMDKESKEVITQPISVYKEYKPIIIKEEDEDEQILQENEVYVKTDYNEVMTEIDESIQELREVNEEIWEDITEINYQEEKKEDWDKDSYDSTESWERETWKHTIPNFPNLDEEQSHKLQELLIEYDYLFAKKMTDLGETDVIHHEIPTGDNQPKTARLWRHSPKDNEFIKEEIDRMLEAGVIRPGSESWSSNVVVVMKKGGDRRFCVDYRPLNKVTKEDKYPLPLIQDLLDSFHGSKYFSTIDLKSGYWQVRVKDKDIRKTAFITNQGLFEFVRMPFGLVNAPATFQRLMDVVLKNEKGEFVQVYLDDIIIYSQTWEEHLEHIEIVLQRLDEAGLKMGKGKCHFGLVELEFLGHIISREGIKPDPKKLKKIKDWPVPQNTKQVRGIIGLASYYRKFIKDFAKIARPLHSIVNEFKWEEPQQEAFDKLRNAILEDAVLQHPDFTKPFILQVDGSGIGMGAVLAQLEETVDKKGKIRLVEKPIAFASKTINDTQSRYSASELEFMALHWATTKVFRKYLLGQKFSIKTDHSAMNGLIKGENGGRRIAKWRDDLVDYLNNITEVKYVSGKLNGNVDALSRLEDPNKRHPLQWSGKTINYKSKLE